MSRENARNGRYIITVFAIYILSAKTVLDEGGVGNIWGSCRCHISMRINRYQRQVGCVTAGPSRRRGDYVTRGERRIAAAERRDPVTGSVYVERSSFACQTSTFYIE
jgi:hypothetical protein